MMIKIKQKYVKCRNEKEWREYMNELDKMYINHKAPTPPEFPAIFVDIVIDEVHLAIPVTLKQFSEG